MFAQKRIEEFLLGERQALGLVGQTGSGKLFTAELAAKAAGFQATVLDRTQGSTAGFKSTDPNRKQESIPYS